MSAVRARDAEQPGLLVDQAAQGGGVEPAGLEQVEQHARIEIAAPRAHHQAAGRREPHGRVDANAVVHGGHARPVAEVRDDHPAVGRVAVERAQLLQDVLVGEAVEAVAHHSGVPELPWQGVHLRDAGHLAVEGRVEAGHLRNARIGLPHALDDLERLRQVLRVEGNQRPQLGE